MSSTSTRNPSGRLDNPDAVLSRTDLRDLGYERRAIDAIFRKCPVIALTERKTYVRVRDYLAVVEAHTFRDDKVRPC